MADAPLRTGTPKKASIGLRFSRAMKAFRGDHCGRFFDSTSPYDPGTVDHYRDSDAGSANAHANLDARQQIREMARYEVANNSHLKSMTKTAANDLIGTSPRVQVTDNRFEMEEQRAIEKRYHEWLKSIKFASKLRTQVVAKIVDGEGIGFFFPIAESQQENYVDRVKLGYRLLDCDRLTNGQLGSQPTKNNIDGITVNQYGDPVTLDRKSVV